MYGKNYQAHIQKVARHFQPGWHTVEVRLHMRMHVRMHVRV